MRLASPHAIELDAEQRTRLRHVVAAHTSAQRLVLRARIVLLAAAGLANEAIARKLNVCVDTVRKWRRRWYNAGGDLACLADAPRTGRPPSFRAVQVAQVKALACTPPAEAGLPLSRWSCPELARYALAQGICTSISATTVRRWLCEDALKPWQFQSWIFIRDPDFAAKAQRVLDLYARQWNGQPLGRDEYVISADEKTSIQARCRCHPSLPAGKSRTMRVNHDYTRGGALAYLAAYDVHRAIVHGRCAPTTGIDAFTALVDQVMSQQPYKSARRVFWIVDNGSSHRGQAAIDRLATRYPNAIMVHTPVHASWLNQVEIFFSIIQRKVLSPNEFSDLSIVEQRLTDFETSYNAAAKPFKWKFTAADLEDLLARIDKIDNSHTRRHNAAEPAQPRAA